MTGSVADRLLERMDVRSFYARYAELSAESEKGECRGLCPLHQEKTPSFYVNVKTGSFKCFGCGSGGGPVQFYAAYDRVSPSQASAELCREFGIGQQDVPRNGTRTASHVRALPPDVPPREAGRSESGSRCTRRCSKPVGPSPTTSWTTSLPASSA